MNRAHKFDVIVVGAGGAGLMAARYAAQHPGVSVAVISKLYPTRSHTGAAQGGVGAALGKVSEDHPEWHAFDTIKGVLSGTYDLSKAGDEWRFWCQ